MTASSAFLIGVSFILVWIAEGLGVADNFPLYGATGLLVSMVLLALLGPTYLKVKSSRAKKV